MKTPTINSRILKLEVLKGTATRTSVNAVESRTTSLESDVATLTQGIASAVSTHNTAPDAHADIRTLVADRALSVHQHARTDLPWVTEPGAALLTAESASAQRTALGMTAWAVAPWTDGTTSDIPEGTQLYFTNARADARIAAQKGQADGIMPLDSSGKAPLAYMPDALIGQVKFKGVWDAATNSPVLPSATTSMGHYYVTSVAGSYGGIDYGVGDWCISDGTTWGKVDNSDAITSFAGRVGAIIPISSDYSAHYLGLHAQADDAAKLGGQLPSYYSANGHTHAQSAIDSSSGWITTAIASKQAAGSYLTTTGTAADSAKLGGVAASGYSLTTHAHSEFGRVRFTDSGGLCAIFESSHPDAQFRLINLSTGGHAYSFGSGGASAGAGAGFYVYDETRGAVVFKLEAATGQPRFSYLTQGALVSDSYGYLSVVNGFTGTKVIGGTTCTFVNGLLVS